jgi:hypothetical protein
MTSVKLATAVLVAWFATTAECLGAKTYDVHGCRLPNGTTIPTAGWEPSGVGQGSTIDTCGQGGALTAALAERETGDYEEVAWRFVAPADTLIDNFRLVRAVRVSGHRDYHLWQFTVGAWPPARTDSETCMAWFGSCSALGDLSNPASPSNVKEAAAVPGTRVLDAWLRCSGHEGPNIYVCSAARYPDSGVVTIWSSRIGLADSLAPVFTNPPTGTFLQTPRPQRGVQVVKFAATDRGGGIQTMGLLVDGEPRAVQPVDRPDQACRTPYLAVVPCPLAVEPTLAVDTREIPNGTHSVRVTVTDVAGNQTQSDPFAVTIRNGGQPNGANATSAAKLLAWFRSSRAHRTTATVGFNARRTVEGRVATADGRPIGAAVLQASVQAMRPGSRVRSLGNIVTDAEGRFRFVLPRGSSREVHLGYRADTFDEQEAAGATLSLNVRAGVRLTVTPRRVRNGTTATFSGRLLGGPGQFGTQVTIYALGGRRPIPVETVPADRRGRFRYRYRFSSISGRGGFRFRAVVKSQPNYPYASGGSRAVTVRARP